MAFDAFDRFLKDDFIKFSNQINIKKELELYKKIMNIRDELLTSVKFSELLNKSHIGIGGSFSAGKSSFLNSVLGRDIDSEDILPIDSVPTTSIPTYIVKKKNNETVENVEVYTFNKSGHKSKIDRESFMAISHEFNKIYGFGLTSVIDRVLIGVESMPYKYIAFLDTPGYSKADGESDIDKNIAKEHLKNIDSMIWLIDADNGIIRDGDIKFIQNLDFKGDILFVLNKADKKPLADIGNIIEAIKKTLDNVNINYTDVVAYSSHDKEEYLSSNKIDIFLEEKNIAKPVDFQFKIMNILEEYYKYIKISEEKYTDLLRIFNQLDLYGNDITVNIDNFERILENIRLEKHKNSSDLKSYTEIKKNILELIGVLDSLFNSKVEMEYSYFYVQYALELIELEKYKEALLNLNKAIKLNSKTADSYYLRALLYLDLEDLNKAIIDINRAISLEPSNTTYIELKNILKV